MRTLGVAQAKAQLSALLDAVESGENVEITRLTRAAERPAAGFDPHAFLTAPTNQPLHKGSAIASMREEAR